MTDAEIVREAPNEFSLPGRQFNPEAIAALARMEAREKRLREALEEIVGLHKEGHADCFSDAADDYAQIAADTLKEEA